MSRNLEYFHVGLTQPQSNSGTLYTVHVSTPINSVRKYGITALPYSIFPHSHIKCDSQHLPILRKNSILTTVRPKTSKWSLSEAQWNNDMNKWPNVLQIKNKYPTVSLECPCKYLSLSLFATTFQCPPRTHPSSTFPYKGDLWAVPAKTTCFGCFPKLRQHISDYYLSLQWTPRCERQWL